MSLIDRQTRLKPFTSIYNFRDFGGYAGLDGRAVRTGHLFRSAHLHNLNDEDFAAIDNLPIGVVVDLRHAPERARQPSKWPGEGRAEGGPAARVFTLPSAHPDEQAKVAPHEAFTQTELKTAEDARRYMTESYTRRLDEPGFQDIFRRTLEHLSRDPSDQRTGLLVHCAAGKDRTGTLCALVLGVLGVSKDDIMADYMLTAEAVDIEAMLEPAAAHFSQRYNRPFSADALRPMFGVEADYLAVNLERLGDFVGYATQTLGLSPDQIAQIRENYLEK